MMLNMMSSNSYNYIGCDLSLSSTAITIESNNKTTILCYNQINPTNKWIKALGNNITSTEINRRKSDEYSTSEIYLLEDSDITTTKIVSDIICNIDTLLPTKICIEGYSYSSDVGRIIDIVTFSTLFRYKISTQIPNLSSIKILSPKTVKTTCCKIVYGYTLTKRGKEIINKNPNGMAGGNFTKFEMLDMIHDSKIIHPLNEFINNNYTDIRAMANIPKPIDDIIDSIFIKEIAKII